MKRTRVSLAILVRDQEATLGHTIASAQSFVDEVMVRDTGSSDGSIALATTMGATVLRGNWKDDFAAARNQLLSACTADWVLMLDADELLLSGGDTLREIVRRPTAAAYNVEIESPIGFGRVDCSRAPRLLKRADVRFQYRVHEQLVGRPRIANASLRIEHRGFAGSRRVAKAARNLALLDLDLRDQPDNAYLQWRRGQELDLLSLHDEAHRAFDRLGAGLARMNVQQLLEHAFAPEALGDWMTSLDCRQRLAEAVPASGRVLLACPDRPLARYLHARALEAAGRLDHARAAARVLLEPRSWRYEAPQEAELLTLDGPELLARLRQAQVDRPEVRV